MKDTRGRTKRPGREIVSSHTPKQGNRYCRSKCGTIVLPGSERVASHVSCRADSLYGYMFIFLKREPGMAHTSSMIKDQNLGT